MNRNIQVVAAVLTVVSMFAVIRYKSLTHEEDKQLLKKGIDAILYCNTFNTYSNQDVIVDNVLLNSNVDSCRLKDLVTDSEYLFFLYPANGCGACIDFCESSIAKCLAKEFIVNNLVVLTCGPQNDYSYSLKLEVKYKYSLQENLNIPLIKENIPFFFMLNGDMEVKLLFIPDRRLLSETQAYFNVIEKILEPKRMPKIN